MAGLLGAVLRCASVLPGMGRELDVIKNARLELTPSSQTVSKDGVIEVTAILRNVGKRPLWVNERMLVNTVHSPRYMRELWLDLTGPDGGTVDFECKVRAGAASARNYRVLSPGARRRIKLKLDECFDFGRPGTYLIKANYQDGTIQVPAAPHAEPHFGDALESNSIRVEVLGAKGSSPKL